MSTFLDRWMGTLVALATLTFHVPISAQVNDAAPDRTDPLYQTKGDNSRSYFFIEAGETSPYRVYVPASWSSDKYSPLVVILHGGSGTQDSPFKGDRTGVLKAEADKHGFILLAPYGYLGAWGSDLILPPAPEGAAPPGPRPARAGEAPVPEDRMRPRDTDRSPQAMRKRQLAEKDVMNVLRRTMAEYHVDPKRVYLMGNSGGAIGTMFLAQRFPGLWAAIAPSNAPVDSATYPFERLIGLKGAYVIHGQLDNLTREDLMRRQADRIRAQGIDTRYVDVPGATHQSAFYDVLPEIFRFFASKRLD